MYLNSTKAVYSKIATYCFDWEEKIKDFLNEVLLYFTWLLFPQEHFLFSVLFLMSSKKHVS